MMINHQLIASIDWRRRMLGNQVCWFSTLINVMQLVQLQFYLSSISSVEVDARFYSNFEIWALVQSQLYSFPLFMNVFHF